VPNTEFEGGEDGHGCGDCTFLVKQAQPSHIHNLHTAKRKAKSVRVASSYWPMFFIHAVLGFGPDVC
jgi:hypothetical protein